MRDRMTMGALGVLLVLGSVSGQPVETKGAAAEEIARLLEVHRTEYLKGDADAWAALYAENAIFASGARSIEGRQAIREYFAQVFKDFPTRTASVHSMRVRVYNEATSPTAIINLDNDATRTDASGKQLILNFRESLVFVKIHGKWLIVDHHASARP